MMMSYRVEFFGSFWSGIGMKESVVGMLSWLHPLINQCVYTRKWIGNAAYIVYMVPGYFLIF